MSAPQLRAAVRALDPTAVRALLANPNAAFTQNDLGFALCIACRRASPPSKVADIVSVLLLKSAGVAVHWRDPGRVGSTPLHYAAGSNSVAAAALLITNGADVNLFNHAPAPYTPLMLASHWNRVEVASLLLDRGAEVDAMDNTNGLTALHIACNAGAVSTARVLIDRGADVSQPRATGGDTPLILAAYAGQEEIVRLLLSYPNTDVNHRNAQGATPLIIASQRGHCLVVRRLLAKRADCYRRLTSGRAKVTALGAACRAGHLEIVQVLLAHMSASYDLTMTSVAARTRSMRTSCARSRQFRCARVKGNYSALCHACANGHVEVVRILLEFGMDPFRTGRGRNAFDYARRHPNVRRILRPLITLAIRMYVFGRPEDHPRRNQRARDHIPLIASYIV